MVERRKWSAQELAIMVDNLRTPSAEIQEMYLPHVGLRQIQQKRTGLRRRYFSADDLAAEAAEDKERIAIRNANIIKDYKDIGIGLTAEKYNITHKIVAKICKKIIQKEKAPKTPPKYRGTWSEEDFEASHKMAVFNSLLGGPQNGKRP